MNISSFNQNKKNANILTWSSEPSNFTKPADEPARAPNVRDIVDWYDALPDQLELVTGVPLSIYKDTKFPLFIITTILSFLHQHEMQTIESESRFCSNALLKGMDETRAKRIDRYLK